MHGGVAAQFNTSTSRPLVKSRLSHFESFLLLDDRPLNELDGAVTLADLVVRLVHRQLHLALTVAAPRGTEAAAPSQITGPPLP